MLRIRFSCEDLARVRMARAADPLWETALSLRVLEQQRAGARLSAWQREARRRLTPAARRLLRLLVPPSGHPPDFLTPTRGGVSLEEALERVPATPSGPVPRGVGAQLEPDQVRRAVAGYFRLALAPHWSRIEAAVAAERARLARVGADDGVGRMLESLCPGASWRPPELRVPHRAARDLELGGRDLVLLPAVFCPVEAVTRHDLDGLPPVLVFRAGGSEAPLERPDAAQAPARRLARLLGRTRAAVLAALTTSHTTSELAGRLGISPASASQHATVLREAGLITTVRQRNAVLHSATALGTELLEHR